MSRKVVKQRWLSESDRSASDTEPAPVACDQVMLYDDEPVQKEVLEEGNCGMSSVREEESDEASEELGMDYDEAPEKSCATIDGIIDSNNFAYMNESMEPVDMEMSSEESEGEEPQVEMKTKEVQKTSSPVDTSTNIEGSDGKRVVIEDNVQNEQKPTEIEENLLNERKRATIEENIQECIDRFLKQLHRQVPKPETKNIPKEIARAEESELATAQVKHPSVSENKESETVQEGILSTMVHATNQTSTSGIIDSINQSSIQKVVDSTSQNSNQLVAQLVDQSSAKTAVDSINQSSELVVDQLDYVSNPTIAEPQCQTSIQNKIERIEQTLVLTTIDKIGQTSVLTMAIDHGHVPAPPGLIVPPPPVPRYEEIEHCEYKFEIKRKEDPLMCECRGKGLECTDSRACSNLLTFMECPKGCLGNKKDCKNRKFSKREYANVRAFYTGPNKGFGVVAMEPIKKGQFIIEYVGEVVSADETAKRIKRYARDNHTHHYMFEVGNITIDATVKGNCSRFMNHSCDPNAICQKWTVPRDPAGIPRIGFFAEKDIERNEEVTFDYLFECYGREAQQCHCGASTCKGWIGVPPQQDNDADEGSDEEDPDESETDSEPEEEEEEIRPERGVAVTKRWKPCRMSVAEVEEKLRVMQAEPCRNKTHALKWIKLMTHMSLTEHKLQTVQFIDDVDRNLQLVFVVNGLLKVFRSWLRSLTWSREELELKLTILRSLSLFQTMENIASRDAELLDTVSSLASREIPPEVIVIDVLEGVVNEVCERLNDKQDPETPKHVDFLESYCVRIGQVAARLVNTWQQRLSTFRIPKKTSVRATAGRDALRIDTTSRDRSRNTDRGGDRDLDDRDRHRDHWRDRERRGDYNWFRRDRFGGYNGRRKRDSYLPHKRRWRAERKSPEKERDGQSSSSGSQRTITPAIDAVPANKRTKTEQDVSLQQKTIVTSQPPPPPIENTGQPASSQAGNSQEILTQSFQTTQPYALNSGYMNGMFFGCDGFGFNGFPPIPFCPPFAMGGSHMAFSMGQRNHDISEFRELYESYDINQLRSRRDELTKEIKIIDSIITIKEQEKGKEHENAVLKSNSTEEVEPVQLKNRSPPPPPDKIQYSWSKAVDEDGAKYYYHKITRESRWELPDGEQCDPAEKTPKHMPDTSGCDVETEIDENPRVDLASRAIMIFNQPPVDSTSVSAVTTNLQKKIPEKRMADGRERERWVTERWDSEEDRRRAWKMKEDISTYVGPIIRSYLDSREDATFAKKDFLIKQVSKEMLKRESTQPDFNFKINEKVIKRVSEYAHLLMRRKLRDGGKDLYKGFDEKRVPLVHYS